MKENKTNLNEKCRIKYIMKEKNILMKDLADKMEIKRESLSRTINGNPKFSTLCAIADALEVDVKNLFVETQRINGYIEFDGHIYSIKTTEDFKKMVEIIYNKL